MFKNSSAQGLSPPLTSGGGQHHVSSSRGARDSSAQGLSPSLSSGGSQPHVSSSRGARDSRSSTITKDAEREPEARSRDLLQEVPLFATESQAHRSQSSSRRAQQRQRQQCKAETTANDMIRGLQALYRGSVEPKTEFGARVRPDRDSFPSPEVEGLRRELLEIAEDHNRRVAGNLCAKAALERLTKEGISYNHVSRGDIVRANVENIDLPATERKVEISALGGSAGELIKDWKSIIKEPAPSEAEVAAVGSYGDPGIRGTLRLRLAARMWMAGMLRGCRRTCPVGVDVFTVHKKTKDGIDLQRLIFDLRRVNLFFERPWPCALGSLSALCGLDLSDRVVSGGAACRDADGAEQYELMGLVGDVPDFFYRCLIPSELSGYFWLLDVDPKELYDYLKAQGVTGAEVELLLESEAVGMRVLPMGWSWAPWFAQELLQKVLSQGVPDFHADGAMRHGHPPPAISVAQPIAHMEYMDDFGAIVLQARQSSLASDVQDQARRALKGCGLDVHKEALGAVLDLLGSEINLLRRLVLPKGEKFAVVICATQGVVAAGSASPHQVEVLLGHWTHYALLNRVLFSVMDEVYEFVRLRARQPIELPRGVRAELALLVALAPLVRADLSLDWCSTVSMVDAGPHQGAVVYAEFSRAEVAEEGRSGLVTGWAYGMPPEPVPESWSDRRWRVGARQRWRTEEHNNITEGRCVVMAVQRLSRCQKGRHCRMLVITDSLVALGCFRKGRSSNKGLLYQSRRLAGLSLGYNIRLALRYVRSERNLADGPSRGAAFRCVAADTVRKAAHKVSTRLSGIQGKAQ